MHSVNSHYPCLFGAVILHYKYVVITIPVGRKCYISSVRRPGSEPSIADLFSYIYNISAVNIKNIDFRFIIYESVAKLQDGYFN